MHDLISRVKNSWRDRFGGEPAVVAAAPGRVNLIGEHTDYSGGYVFPAAIDRAIVIALSGSGEKVVRGVSLDFGEEAECPVGSYDPHHTSGWFRYVMGVLSELSKTGVETQGFNFTLAGDIPAGSGLSSSAALETAVLTAVEGLMGFHMKDTDAALLCQRAENLFVGVNCGIMDQLISRSGRKNSALFIDCTDLSMTTVPATPAGTVWVVVNSKKRRGLVDTEYNRRRSECEEAFRIARERFPERRMTNLRGVAVDDLSVLRSACPDAVFHRLRHVVTENDRVVRAVEALKAGDAPRTGALLAGSHASLRDDFEVSCAELDRLVDILSETPGVHGARLTGAGFGGCVIALAERSAMDVLTERVLAGYRPPAPSDHADIWPVEPSDGARIVS